jgi:hypothetical protein
MSLATYLAARQYKEALECAYQKGTRARQRLHVHLRTCLGLPEMGYFTTYYTTVSVLGALVAPHDELETRQWQSPVFRAAYTEWNASGMLCYQPSSVTSVRVTLLRTSLWCPDTVLASMDVVMSETISMSPLVLTLGPATVTLCARLLHPSAPQLCVPVTEHTLPLRANCHAVVHCLQTCSSHTKAILWLPGRHDGFHHAHVAQVMATAGFDLYVLNWRGLLANGPTLGLGTADLDPRLLSHVPSGTLTTMFEEIDACLALMRSVKHYRRTISYSHSTGSTILAMYLATRGDASFDAFYLNSPFLNWGAVGGPLTHFVVRIVVPALVWCFPRLVSMLVRDRGVMLSPFFVHHYAACAFPSTIKSMIEAHVTAGFVAAATNAFRHLERRERHGLVLTTKPVGFVTSLADDILIPADTMTRSKWWGMNRPVPDLILDTGSHDVFLSPLSDDVEHALEHLRLFLSE